MMISQYVSHFTVGWNDIGELVPIPVLARFTQTDNKRYGMETDSLVKTSIDRKCTILLVDDLFEFDNDDNSLYMGQLWYVNKSIIHAHTANSANDAIRYIKNFLIKGNANDKVNSERSDSKN